MRKGTERSFGKDVMKGSSPRVPQQDNFSDCGVYILQYVESFFEVRTIWVLVRRPWRKDVRGLSLMLSLIFTNCACVFKTESDPHFQPAHQPV